MVLQLARLLRGSRQLSALVICVFLSFVSLALPPRAKDAVSNVLSGLALGPFKRMAGFTAELVAVRGENSELRVLAADLMADRADLLEYKHENDRLRELLGFLVSFPEDVRFEMLPARVIGMPGGRIVEQLEVDKGERDGVRPGMPVVVPEGVVGKVSRTFWDRSLVEPLASSSAAVSVTIERSGVRGIVRRRYGGVAELAGWEMDYVPARSDVRRGDLVVTSGLGGVYPPRLVVGTVRSVHEDPLTMGVLVRLAVDFPQIEQVFVLTEQRDAQSQPSDRQIELLMQIDELRRARSGE